MTTPFKPTSLAISLMAAAVLSACGGGGSDDAVVVPAADKLVSINFAALNGVAPSNA